MSESGQAVDILEGRELDLALGRALGLDVLMGDDSCPNCGHRAGEHSGGDMCRACQFARPGDAPPTPNRCGDYDWDYPSSYSSSVDALSAGPEKRLREAGLTQNVETDGDRWIAHWTNPAATDTPEWWGKWAGSTALASTEALARARAALMALVALRTLKGD